jgi:hypothetical protein
VSLHGVVELPGFEPGTARIPNPMLPGFALRSGQQPAWRAQHDDQQFSRVRMIAVRAFWSSGRHLVGDGRDDTQRSRQLPHRYGASSK